MKDEFDIAYRILVLGTLEPYYPISILAYAFDISQEQVESILNNYHQGADKALEDSIRILIQDQALTEENIYELFSTIPLKKTDIDIAIGIAHGNPGTELPDSSASEVCTEAFRTGYIYMSSLLFHELKIRTESTIEEINALFSMNPEMDRFISDFSHGSDKVNLEAQLFGEKDIDDAFNALNSLVGREVTGRLKEYRKVGEFNRELRRLPEDIQNKVSGILLNDIIPMIKEKASYDEIMEAAQKAFTDAGLMDETNQTNPEDEAK